MSELKNCPFCGSEAEYKTHRGVWRYHHIVRCKNDYCVAHFGREHPTFETKKESVQRWNQRTKEAV